MHPFELTNLNVTLIWVPEHHGKLGNEETDKIDGQASAKLPLGPELAFEIPKCLGRETKKNRTAHQQFITWTEMPCLKKSKFFIDRTSKKRA
jgi:hypothetical protein